MDYEKWFNDAKNRIAMLQSGAVFEVKNLYEGTTWNKLTAGEKKSFGRYFSNQIKDGILPDVYKNGEGKTHHNKYIKR